MNTSITPAFSPYKIFLIGGSQNIGYHTALRLMEQGHIVTYLLRSPAMLDEDVSVQKYVQSGHARLVYGDALIEADVRRGWEEAGKGGSIEGAVDFLISTVGGGGFSLTRGVFLDPPDLCTRAMRTVLSAIPEHLRMAGSQPCMIAISTTGLGKAGVAALPFLHRMTYPTLLAAPHHDKMGLELVLAHASDRLGTPGWIAPSEKVKTNILPAGWQSTSGLPSQGELFDVLLIRPAWLTDGPETGAYRVVDGQGDKKCKTMSRQDVAHFIAKQAVPSWDKWSGKAVTLGSY